MEKYETLGLVGEGSYGTVMKCRHKENGRIVAVKRFLDSEDDKTVRKIVLREIKMLKHLHHENLVNLLEVFKKRRRWYLVFEFVEHTVLDDLEQSPSGLDYKRLRRYLYQILRAVSFCHQHNIIHRDIKPENILVSQGGVVKLCDFGFARTMATPGENYTDYVATRWYRAPELLVGDTKYGKAVDMWAVGCLCVEMLTGEPLFPGDSDIDQLYLIIRCLGNLTPRHQELFYQNPVFSGVNLPEVSDREPLEQRYPKLSATTRDLTQTCLQMDPNRRPNCSDLLQHQLFTNDGFHIRFVQELNAKIQREQKQTSCLPRMNKTSRKEKGAEWSGNNKDSGRTSVKTSEHLSVAKTDTTTESKPKELDRTSSDSKPREITLTDSKPRNMTITDSKPNNMTLTVSKPKNTTLTDSKHTLTDSKHKNTTFADSKFREMSLTDSKPRNTTVTDSKLREMSLTDSKPRDLDRNSTETTKLTKTMPVKPRPEDLEMTAKNHVGPVNHGRMTTISLNSATTQESDRTEENQSNPGRPIGPIQDQPLPPSHRPPPTPLNPPLLHHFTHTHSNNTFTHTHSNNTFAHSALNNTFTHTASYNSLATITQGNGLMTNGKLGEVGPHTETVSLRSIDKAKKHMNLFSRITQQSLSSPLSGNLTSQMILEKSVIHERSFLPDRDHMVLVGKRKPEVMRSEFHFPELKPPLLPELRGAEGKQIKACNKEQKNDRTIPYIKDTHTPTHTQQHTPTHTNTHTTTHTHHL